MNLWKYEVNLIGLWSIVMNNHSHLRSSNHLGSMNWMRKLNLSWFSHCLKLKIQISFEKCSKLSFLEWRLKSNNQKRCQWWRNEQAIMAINIMQIKWLNSSWTKNLKTPIASFMWQTRIYGQVNSTLYSELQQQRKELEFSHLLDLKNLIQTIRKTVQCWFFMRFVTCLECYIADTINASWMVRILLRRLPGMLIIYAVFASRNCILC